MSLQESESFVLASHSQYALPITVRYTAHDEFTADLTLEEEGGRVLFSSPRANRKFLAVLQGVDEMERRAKELAPSDSMRSLGCLFIARTGRQSVANTLGVRELAAWD